MRYKQCVIKSGTSRIVAWLDADKIKVGIRITLKNSDEPRRWWKVLEISNHELVQKDIDKNHNPKALFGSL